jgi:putative DNA methylase
VLGIPCFLPHHAPSGCPTFFRSPYPKVEVTAEMAKDRPDLNPYVGKKLNVIAWIWARTVKSPNPAFSEVEVPLASTFMLCTKAGKEAYVEPVIEGETYRFTVKTGNPKSAVAAKNGTKLSRGGNFRCLMSGEPMNPEYIKAEGIAGRMGARMMAIIADGDRCRLYLKPTPEQEGAASDAKPSWKPEGSFVEDARAFTPCIYGIKKWSDVFTNRQLLALTTFSELVQEAREKVKVDALAAGRGDETTPLCEGGTGFGAYGDAVGVYLGFGVSKIADRNSALNTWASLREHVKNTFTRQALSMTWDFSECNVLSSSSGNFAGGISTIESALSPLGSGRGHSRSADASSQILSYGKVISTDPPYYDNIPYADLSDFFYVWLRRQLKPVFPDLFATLAVPKADELVATPYRHGGRESAEGFFLDGMTHAMVQLADQAHPAFPITIYYAFKQSESRGNNDIASTGWETFLAAVIRAGLELHGTWPVRTELSRRVRGMESNALATSVVLVCERRSEFAPTLSRNDFRRHLRKELPKAMKELERANIAPVDVAQAAIGPGMAIFSSAKAVLNPDDSPMSVREALIEVNAALDEYLSQDEGDLDADSRFALTFFESFGYKERDFGDAEGLAKARNLSVDGVAKAGILRSVAGKVRLLPRAELPEDWDPASDKRLCVWEATQQLIKRLEAGGEDKAAELLFQLKSIAGHGDLAANCRALAYRLYNHCEKTKQAEEARSYNGLVIAWPELEKRAAAASGSSTAPLQTTLI